MAHLGEIRIEFLRESSPALLGSVELASLNRAANMEKEIRVMLEQWANDLATALLARFLIDNRDALLHMRVDASQKVFDFPADDLRDRPAQQGFADRAVAHPDHYAQFDVRKRAR